MSGLDQSALEHSVFKQDGLVSSCRDAVLHVIVNRPETRNALSEAMIQALTTVIDAASLDVGVRAVVVSAHGPVFSAGHDLKELSARRSDADGGEAYFRHMMQACATMMQAIVSCPKPIIAAVEGIATAAGCQLVATCDLAVAGAAARFATPGVNIGLFCSTPMVALSRNVARKHAMEMLLLGDMVDAERARDIGLVNRVVGAGDAVAEAKRLAQQIASKSAVTVAVGKAAFYRQLEVPLSDAYAQTTEIMVRNMLSRDAREGIGAFIDKRPALWDGH